MKAIEFTKDMLVSAKIRADSLGVLNNSITNGRGNLAGFIGEEAIAGYLGASIVGTFNHDIILKNGESLEVKTKRRSVVPAPYFEGSIAEKSTHQKPDIYAFMSTYGKLVNGTRDKYCKLYSVWLCGFISYGDFFDKAVFYKKGTKFSNGFTSKADMYNLPYSKLHANINNVNF